METPVAPSLIPPSRRWMLWVAVWTILLGVLGGVWGGLDARALSPLADDDGRGGEVVVVPIEGTIDLGLVPFVQRAIAEHPDARAILLDIDTHGGRVDAAVQIRDVLLETDVPVVAFINRRAISAGALIGLAADSIVFAPGATMGAATPVTIEGGEMEPVGEKVVSYMRAEMRATAEATGRDGQLAEAMVDADVAIEGVVEAGKLLTLTTEQASALGLAAAVAEDQDEVMQVLGLSKATPRRMVENWAETFARFVTDPTVAGLLMSLGVLGIMVELYSPGFGIPGTVGISALVLFFFGHATVALVGWEEVILVGLGGIALLVEVLVIPGFGVTGVVGIVLIVVGLALALVGAPLDVAWDLGDGPGGILHALYRVVVALAGTLLAMVAVVAFVPQRALPRWLVLQAKIGDHAPGAVAPEDARTRPHGARVELVGQEGDAATDLRPSGKASIDGEIVDVVSLHEYIRAGARIVVIEVEGMRVVVQRKPDSKTPDTVRDAS